MGRAEKILRDVEKILEGASSSEPPTLPPMTITPFPCAMFCPSFLRF